MSEHLKSESLRDVSVTRIGDTLSYGFPQTGYVNQRKDYLDEVSDLVGSGIFELTSNDLCTFFAIIETTVQLIQRFKRLKRKWRATINSFNQ